MDLNFTEAEKYKFLTKLGYKFKKILTNFPSGDYNIEIAYIEDVLPTDNDYRTASRYSINSVFEKEVKIAFKKLILGI